MSQPRRKYDPEFRAGAVRIVRETRRPIAEIARELGIGAGVLGNWVRKDKIERGEAEGLSSDDTAAKTSNPSRSHSIPDHAKPSTGEPQQRPSTNSYTPPNKTVLRRPLEPGQYTSDAFAAACRRLGVTQSMGRVGCALDNAAAESFFSTLEHELVTRRHHRTRDQARADIAAWIDTWYNTKRLHSTNNMLSPNDYELANAA